MFNYYYKNILEHYKYDTEYLINRICTDKLVVTDEMVVCGWHERVSPPYAGASHHDVIERVDAHSYEYRGEVYTPNSFVRPSGRLYTDLKSSSGKEHNFQSLPKKTRSEITWNGERLSNYDVSASQLRIAMALKGNVLPTDTSPWDELVARVRKAKFDAYPAEKVRPFVKRVALQHVKGVKGIDITDYCKEETKIEPHPPLKGVKKLIETELVSLYPELANPLALASHTPDGYLICSKAPKDQRERFRTKKIKRMPSGKTIDTHFFIDKFLEPTLSNYLEAMEAYVLRRVIQSIPKKHPVLTVHDQVYILEKDLSGVEKEFYSQISRLSELGS